MIRPCLLRTAFAAVFFFYGFANISAICVDSIQLTVQSVQCYGLRNGLISVDTVFGGEKPFYYSIDGQTFSTRPEFDRLWAGNYTIYVRDASNCMRTWQVEVTEPEELVVEMTADATSIEAGQAVRLRADVWPDTADIQLIDWRPPFLFDAPNDLEQTAYPKVTTTFAVEIVDKNECVARDQVTVEVTRSSVYFPNIINPTSNSDDYFTVFSGESVAQVVILQVYARTGEMVFQRQNFQPNDPVKGWNGRLKGRRVQAGAYVWVAVVEYLDGTQRQFSGAVTVVY